MSNIHQYIQANMWYNDNDHMSFCVILIRKKKKENPEDTQPKAAEPCWQGLCQPQSHEQFAHTTHIHTCVGLASNRHLRYPVLPANQDLHALTHPTALSPNQSSSAPAAPQAKARASLMALLLSNRLQTDLRSEHFLLLLSDRLQTDLRSKHFLLLLSDTADWTVYKQTWGLSIFISSSTTSKAKHRIPPPLWFGHQLH